MLPLWSTLGANSQHTGRSSSIGPTTASNVRTVLTFQRTGVQGGPTVGADGTLYLAAGDGNVYAITDGSPGTVKWAYAPGGGLYYTVTIADDGTLYVADDTAVYAIDASTNPPTTKWTFTAPEYIDSTPTIGADGAVIFHTGSSNNRCSS